MDARKSIGFDLSAETPLRFVVLTVNGGETFILETAHHVLLDGGSGESMLKEICRADGGESMERGTPHGEFIRYF